VKVDVVVAISEATGLLEGVYCEYKSADILRDARDAIVELFAADEEYDAAVRDRNNCFATDFNAAEVRVAKARVRRAAALLACKGQDHER